MDTIALADNLTWIIPLVAGILVFLFFFPVGYYILCRKGKIIATGRYITVGITVALIISLVTFIIVGAGLERLKIDTYTSLVEAKYNAELTISSIKQVGLNDIPKENSRIKNNNTDEYREVYVVNKDNDIYLYTRNESGVYTKCDSPFS